MATMAQHGAAAAGAMGLSGIIYQREMRVSGGVRTGLDQVSRGQGIPLDEARRRRGEQTPPAPPESLFKVYDVLLSPIALEGYLNASAPAGIDEQLQILAMAPAAGRPYRPVFSSAQLADGMRSLTAGNLGLYYSVDESGHRVDVAYLEG